MHFFGERVWVGTHARLGARGVGQGHGALAPVPLHTPFTRPRSSHPGACMLPAEILLVMEYVPGGSLYHALHHKGGVSWESG